MLLDHKDVSLRLRIRLRGVAESTQPHQHFMLIEEPTYGPELSRDSH